MQRYFIKTSQMTGDIVTITGADVHHITNVMRASSGSQFLLCSDARETFLVEITTITKTEVIVRVVEKRGENVEMPVLVTVAQGITKGDKFDLVVQKTTECGVCALLPVAMKRSVAKIEAGKMVKKVERWQKIALEAARQAHRQVVPLVMKPVEIKGLLALASEYDVCLFAYEAIEEVSKNRLVTITQGLSAGQRVLVLIGPEGGIDQSEVLLLEEVGFKAIGLGPRILRTETAPIYVMSALSYALELSN